MHCINPAEGAEGPGLFSLQTSRNCGWTHSTQAAVFIISLWFNQTQQQFPVLSPANIPVWLLQEQLTPVDMSFHVVKLKENAQMSIKY